MITKGRKTLALKASNSFDNDELELDDNESKEDEDKMAFLSKKLQKILRENRNKVRRRPLPQRKNSNKNE